MGFTKKTWKNRIAEYINRRLLTNEDGSTELVTVARDEGTISQEGDAFNAANMNDLEDRIEAGFTEVNQSLQDQGWKQVGYATKGDAVTLPVDFKELLLILNAPDSTSYSFIYPKALVDAFTLYPTSGGYMNGATYLVNLKLDKTTAMIDRVNVNGQNFTNNSSLYVFCK
jgi:hypothetical protein